MVLYTLNQTNTDEALTDELDQHLEQDDLPTSVNTVIQKRRLKPVLVYSNWKRLVTVKGFLNLN